MVLVAVAKAVDATTKSSTSVLLVLASAFVTLVFGSI
jgi:hypothetical protein